jgi:hypothetical protein
MGESLWAGKRETHSDHDGKLTLGAGGGLSPN